MYKFPGLILLILAFLSCNKEDTIFQIGSDYVDINTNIRYVDTLTVHSYTVRVDSIHTSGLDKPAMLVGKYSDPEIGNISSQSFFRLNPPTSLSLPKDAVYDSMQLVMLYNGYAIGDTTATYTISAHRLNKILRKREDGYLYNTSAFDFDPVPLGTVSLVPRPNTYDTLWIRLDDALGNDLFGLIKDNSAIVQESELFHLYFKGFALSYDDADKVVLGFDFPTNATVSNAKVLPTMRLYYHYFEYEYHSKYVDFPIGYENRSLQFNHTALSDPVVDFPTSQRDKLPAYLSDNTTYFQAGTGIVTRLEIPYLNNLLALHNNLIIEKAELQLEPVRNSYTIFPLNKDVYIYATDKLNRFLSSFAAVADLTVDNIYQEETYYTFDVTNFIKINLATPSEEGPALLVTIAPEDLYKTFDRVVLGSQSHAENRVKLKIYYLNYE
jgi:hypothetical protein